MASCSRAMKGWLGGCLTATVAMEVFGIIIAAARVEDAWSRFAATSISWILFLSIPIFLLTCVLTGIPAAITIWLGERFRIRSVLFYGCAGGAIGALSQTLLLQSFTAMAWVFMLIGFLAGFDYWFVAGKHAGHDHGLPGDIA